VLLALLVLALVAAVLLAPTVARAMRDLSERRADAHARRRSRLTYTDLADPGRERRAEQRARELLRSCVNDEEWGMYRDLGFIRVYGKLAARRPLLPDLGAAGEQPDAPADPAPAPQYAYLIYPHKPIVAYVPETRRLLSEYCVEFPDLTGAISQTRLPDSDDVLAKWMALTGDERRLIRNANMHLPGRQIDPGRVRRDLWRLAEWERQRRGSDSVEARRR
jgi:hypothetical protein